MAYNQYQGQQAQNPYEQYQGNPYQNAGAAENGYGAPQQQFRRASRCAMHTVVVVLAVLPLLLLMLLVLFMYDANHRSPFQEQHEMQPYGQPEAAAGSPVMSQQEYLTQVSNVRGEIRSLTTSVQSIASLHQRALGGNDPSAAQQLEQLVAETQLKNTQIRNQLRILQRDCERTSDSTHALKKRQFETLNNDFKRELQGYMTEEKQYRERYREQISRQYRIVNPDATEEEVNQAADADWGSEGIFQTALRTNRSGQASAVLGAVRARHNELQRIEQSITELNGLFNDLDTLVIQQDPIFTQVEEQTQQTVGNLEGANKQVASATEHARRRRKLKWWCLLVVVLIIIAIALGVGLGVGIAKSSSK